jgi:hypothetical protein
MRLFLTSVSFWAIVIIVGIPVVAWYGPNREEKFFPVLINQTATVVRSGNNLTFYIEVDKVRNCRLVEGGYSVIRGTERTPITVRTLQEGPTVSYPLGHLKLGPFTATLPKEFSDAVSIEGVLFYSCQPFWLTRQVFGPITIPSAAP